MRVRRTTSSHLGRMCSKQARDGFRWLDGECAGDYLLGDTMTQADVTTGCAYEFVRAAAPELFETLACPRLEALSQRLATLDAFRLTAPVT